VRQDLRPYRVKRAKLWFERWYANHFIRPQFDSLGSDPMFMKPWNISVHGPNIHLGEQIHIITARDRKVCFTVWQFKEHCGEIRIGDYCLISPGVRMDSASGIHIGPNSMIASGAYLTDADWHDIYDRPRPIGTTRPIRLGANVWIGDQAIICKGVEIGDNTIVGTGSVVTGSLPANVIAAGNPARVVKPLDTERPMRTRADLLADPAALAAETDALNRYLLSGNGYLNWLRSIIRPGPKD
jgi:acetyltransferase-like isoleucine patch superfamily enzyme